MYVTGLELSGWRDRRNNGVNFDLLRGCISRRGIFIPSAWNIGDIEDLVWLRVDEIIIFLLDNDYQGHVSKTELSFRC